VAPGALALIARAAEGSARDSLSLLDQAIAHGEGEMITADTVRQMLGLADRGRVLDIFEKLMAGKVSEALTDLSGLYDAGADPLAVMQDLLETTHFLTRLKVAPSAQGFFDGGSGEARRAAELAAKLSVASLTRAWQILLKGLFEVRDATRPISACEMALIRLPCRRTAAHRQAGEGFARRRAPRAAPAPACSAAPPRATARPCRRRRFRRSPRPPRNLKTLSPVRAALGIARQSGTQCPSGASGAGRIEIRPTARAPRTLANDLQAKRAHRRALDVSSPARAARPLAEKTGPRRAL
jgi:DNA polymerase-3 subunit gamma/tau